MTNKKILLLVFFLLSAFSVVLNYYPAFSSYFFQDDWYSLLISHPGSLKALPGFFIPNTNVVYYRPLGMQLPFFILASLFGINPFPFRILTLITHLLSSILIYIIALKLNRSTFSAVLVSFFYAVSSVHYLPFFWAATYAFALGPFFFFLTFISYLNYLESGNKKYYFALLFSFLLALLTYETAVVLPLIFFFLQFYLEKLKRFTGLLPLFLISLFYGLFRLLYSPPPRIGAYRVGIGADTIRNIKYYLLWSLNWPEEIKYQFLKFAKVNPDFIKGFPVYYRIFLISLVLNILLLLVIPGLIIFIKHIKINYKFVVFLLAWYFIGLLPVIFFPDHAFAYYLPSSLTGLSLLAVYLLDKSLSGFSGYAKSCLLIIQAVLMANWLISSQAVIAINQKIYWAPRRSEISRRLVTSALAKVTSSDQCFRLIVAPYSENNLALDDQQAMRIIFNNPDIRTIYSDKKVPGYKL